MRRIIGLLIIVILIFSGCSTQTNLKNDNDFRIKKTKHFKIYYMNEDKSCIKDVEKTLESNYERIINDLKSENIDVINVKIYPSKKELQKSITMFQVPDFTVGISLTEDEIRIASPLNADSTHNYEQMLDVLVHEFTHCVTKYVSNNNPLPQWLSEGMALYESKQFRNPKDFGIYTFEEIKDNKNNLIYGTGYVMIEYIIDKWGMEGIRQLIKKNGDIKSTLGISEEEFEKGWHEFIREKYVR